MPRTKLRFSDGHHAGDRARKDQRNAKYRAAKAADLREQVGDIQEDVIAHEHKGGEVGEFVLLKRLRRRPVSDDAPQIPLPVAAATSTRSVTTAAL